MNAPRKKILSGKSLVLYFRIFWALKHWKSPNLRLNLSLVLGSPDPNSRDRSLILGLPDPKIRDLTLELGTSGNASIDWDYFSATIILLPCYYERIKTFHFNLMIVRSKLNHHRDHPVTWIRWGTSTARTRGSPTCPWRWSSENLAAPISKCQQPGKTNQ